MSNGDGSWGESPFSQGPQGGGPFSRQEEGAGFLGGRRRRGSFSLRLALRATLMAVCAIGAAGVLEGRALPKLESERVGMGRDRPTVLKWTGAFQGHLTYVPVPALVLGIAALVLRPFRPLLAGLAMLMAVLAVLIVVGSLLGGLAPMYQLPTELDMK